MFLDHDPWLRRLELQALVICLAMAALGLAVGGVSGGLGVLAGGGLIALMYEAVKGAADAAFRRGLDRPDRGWKDGWRLVKFFTRYAILAVAAYVIVVRLRLHVAGVLAGASSFVLALFVEAGRVLAGRNKPRADELKNFELKNGRIEEKGRLTSQACRARFLREVQALGVGPQRKLD